MKMATMKRKTARRNGVAAISGGPAIEAGGVVQTRGLHSPARRAGRALWRTYFATMPSPIGELLLISDGESLTGLHMEIGRQVVRPGRDWLRDEGVLRGPLQQMAAYFAGELRAFDLPLRLSGTPFQRRVWAELLRIGYGEAISYGELARRIGQPTASRAVGMANGRNPVALIVPCHRVIATGGGLGGYGGGLDRKRWLLEHEARVRGAAIAD